MKSLVIFTDLDGTLLDSNTYSFEAAKDALGMIKQMNIPLIICSSKTRKEIEHYRERLGNVHPFISENGGGIFLPAGYFSSGPESLGLTAEDQGSYRLIRLGADYRELRRAVERLRSEGFAVRGFGDMTAHEIATVTGLSEEEASFALVRDFDEPLVFSGSDEEKQRLIEAIRKMGFNYTEGRFIHILGNSDKGRAVSVVTGLFRRERGEVLTASLGDSPNDLPMLRSTDISIMVRKPNGSYDHRLDLPDLHLADGIGPVGWNLAVTELLKDIQQGIVPFGRSNP